MLVTEGLLRRFDPRRTDNPKHIIIDEGDSPARVVLASGALRFDSDGCSTFREPILARLGMTVSDLLIKPHGTGIARTTKNAVDSYEHLVGETSYNPFSAIASPIVREEPSEAESTDKAHASIVMTDCGISRSQQKRAQSGLAKRAFTIIHGL